jgi:hypothetical protein
MYCPRCGHQSNSDSLRFCSYCGFKLGVVKASLADEDELSGESFKNKVIKNPPRPREKKKGGIGYLARTVLANNQSGG